MGRFDFIENGVPRRRVVRGNCANAASSEFVAELIGQTGAADRERATPLARGPLMRAPIRLMSWLRRSATTMFDGGNVGPDVARASVRPRPDWSRSSRGGSLASPRRVFAVARQSNHGTFLFELRTSREGASAVLLVKH